MLTSVAFLPRLPLHRTPSLLALTNLWKNIGSAEAAISPVDRDQSIGQRDQQMSTQPSEPARIANASPWAADHPSQTLSLAS